MRKYTLSALLSLLLILPWGCGTDGCGEMEASYYQISGMSVANVRLIEGGYSIAENIAAQTEIRYDRFGLHLEPATEYAYQYEAQPASGSFFPAAYACSPMPPQPTDEIADIAIFSSADYVQANSSRIIAAGDTLNAAFNIYDQYSGRIVGLTDFLIDDGMMASDMPTILQPAAQPEAAQTHEFTVHYRLKNGDVYTLSSQPVVLTP